MIEFPIRIDEESLPINIGATISLTKIQDDDRERLFGIKIYEKIGTIASFVKIRHTDLMLNKIDEIKLFGANFLLKTATIEEATDLIFAFKLLSNNNVAIKIGFEDDFAKYHINNPTSFGQKLLFIDKIVEKSIGNLTENIAAQKINAKIALIKEVYLFSFTENIRAATRFLEVAILIEMILIPEKGADVSLRFCLRFTKILNGYDNKSAEELFNISKKIYSTRSDLAHSGTSKSLAIASTYLENYGREIIKRYIQNQENFTDRNLLLITIN